MKVIIHRQISQVAVVKSCPSSTAVWKASDHVFGDAVDDHDDDYDGDDDDDDGLVEEKLIRYADCVFLWYFCTDHVAPGNSNISIFNAILLHIS